MTTPTDTRTKAIEARLATLSLLTEIMKFTHEELAEGKADALFTELAKAEALKKKADEEDDRVRKETHDDKDKRGSCCGECGVSTAGRKIRGLWDNTLCETCGEEEHECDEDDCPKCRRGVYCDCSDTRCPHCSRK